jgi:hypothetical protein
MAEELTIAVVALLGGKALDECVAAARVQSNHVLAVRRDGSIVDGEGAAVGMADRLDIPAKRRSAVELAWTPLVAVIEDTVVPHGGWAAAIVAALGEKEAVACGGPVRIAENLPAQSRALTLSEYGRYNDRQPAGEVAALPGCNFAFRREAVLEAMRGSEGLVDLPAFARLKQAGGKLVWAPAMTVTFAHAYAEGARLKTRFDHGRIYGSDQAGALKRLLTVVKAPLLPAVLTLRSLREAGGATLPTIGWSLLQHSAWAAGELAGALLGPSKEGLGQWR